jgi:ABC-type oligopeptide transport system ATPase subunit
MEKQTNRKYTQTVQNRLATIMTEEKATDLAVAFEMLFANRIAEDKKIDFINAVVNGETPEVIYENYKKPITRTLSQETKQQRYEKQLAQLKAKWGIQ